MKNTASRGIVSRMSNAFIFAGCFLVAFMLFLAVFGWHITTPWSSDYNQLGLSIVYGTTHALFLLGILIRIGLFLCDLVRSDGASKAIPTSNLLFLIAAELLAGSTLLYGIIRVPYNPFDAGVHVYGRQPVVYKNYTAPTILFYSAIGVFLVAVGIRVILVIYKRKHKLA